MDNELWPCNLYFIFLIDYTYLTYDVDYLVVHPVQFMF